MGILIPVLVALALPPQTPAAADTLPAVTGTVKAEGYGSDGLLRGAVVEVRQGERFRRAVVDPAGRYRIEDLRPGGARLSVQHVATRPLEMDLRLPTRGEIVVDLNLERRAIALPPMSIRIRPVPAREVRPLARTQAGRVRLGLRALTSTTGMAESGLAATLPGEGGGEPGRVLYMRGSAVDARMVLLDGAPILTPFHVAGLVEPFDPELLGDAEMYLGGAPSSYDGGLSYLLDVKSRVPAGEAPRLSLSADGLTVRGVAEAPLPLGGGLLVGGRHLHALQGNLTGDGGRFPYGYHDLLVRLSAEPRPGHELRLTGFRNREGVRLDLLEGSADRDEEARWGNRALSLGYAGALGEVGVEAVGAASGYASALPVPWEDPVLARGTGDRVRGGLQVAAPAWEGTLRLGASLEWIRFEYALEPLGRRSTTFIQSDSRGLRTDGVGMFGEWEGEVGAGVRLRAGLRGDRFSHEGRIRWGPRAALEVPVGERAALRLSGGLFHQPLPSPGLERRRTGAETPDALRWSPGLPVASASHLVVGLEQELDGEVYLAVSGFAKGFSGLGPDGDERSRASGAELRLAREGERVHAWLGYALSWFWAQEGLGGSTRFDGRHLLSMGGGGTLPGGVELRATLGYGAGLPLTAVPLPSSERVTVGGFPDRESSTDQIQSLNGGGGAAPLEVVPQDDFLRLDLELAWPLEPRVLGRTTRLRPYLKVLNALDRRDALFHYFDPWRGDDVRPLARQPVLPLLGVEWRF